MGSSYENEKNKNQFRNKNIAEIINSGNSTNHINVCSRSKSKRSFRAGYRFLIKGDNLL
ncbi:hypothetical protein J22TS1_12590 [Siminovitchia terrae]|nr:hypothetical protein J22TS1_12590 [Siminovitchia terrae]